MHVTCGLVHGTNGLAALVQMEEEGVPSTALREVSLLQMLNESNHVVKYDAVLARE